MAKRHVVGHDPQVARERQLEAGADGVALHCPDDDRRHLGPDGEAALEAGDRRAQGRLAPAAEARARTARRPYRPGVSRSRCRPAEKDGPSAAQHHDADGRVQRLAPTAARADHRLGVWALRRSGSSRVTVSTRAGALEPQPGVRAGGVAHRSGQRDEVEVVRADSGPRRRRAAAAPARAPAPSTAPSSWRDQDDGALVGAQGAEDLLARGRVEVVGRLVEQQHVAPTRRRAWPGTAGSSRRRRARRPACRRRRR